jgi:diacylglycerol kinase family enzyme
MDAPASVEILETTRRGAAIELAAASVGTVHRVIAVGGDGTLNEVASGLMSTGAPADELPELGYLPAGTANAAVRAFRVSSDPGAVARALPGAASVRLDVGQVRFDGGERAFLLWCGAGWDAVVIEALNADRSGLMGVSGMLGHVPEVLRALSAYDQPPVSAAVDGSDFGSHSSVLVANVGDIAFGGMVAEGVDPLDGRLDVVGVPPLSVPRTLHLGFLMMTSSLARSPRVRRGAGTRVELRGEGQIPMQIDGEPVGTLPATVTVAPGAIRFLKT